MQLTGEINDITVSPSFNCYSSDSLTAKAAAKVSREVEQERIDEFQEFSEVDEEDFEFSLEFAGEEFSAEELALAGRLLFPIFNSDLVTKDEVDRVVKEVDDEHDVDSLIIPLHKLFVDDSDESRSSSSSSEVDDLEDRPSGTFCVSWRKANAGSPTLAKKSRSTGSGSRTWKIKDLLRRSNSTGSETVFFLCPKRVEASNRKRYGKSREVRKVTGKSKTASSPSFHELFYVQKRAEQKGEKMKSYLPYRQDLLGFSVKVNGSGNKKLPF
ncbi:uncharacterized protein LOC112515623 [Cynara cardunculus var. scolymus]|uniref:Uncharacterized protein n=1 Tax=Cynara cardunculus var. scolymus TaxID=59895 RepID=A0A103XLH2_CYNCS|nr:uncharacterized protein LOC112515623 [Cynara cardunculus var. scolymus]KVH92873.1 Protein of unknown function DUF1645 [Cynara cardunculus var. scolymus]